MELHNRKVLNSNVAWANSAAANTAVNLDFAQTADDSQKELIDLTVAPRLLSASVRYLVLVRNPSAVTALTVRFRTRWTDDALGAQIADLRDGAADKTLSVPVNSSKSMVVEGLNLGDGARLTLSNDTLLGATDGFTARVQVRSL